MFLILHVCALFLGIVGLVLTIRLALSHSRKAAWGWATICVCSWAVFALYYAPFHIRVNPQEQLLLSFDAGPHVLVDASTRPETFFDLSGHLETLTFHRPFFSDPRVERAFVADSLTVTNGKINLYFVPFGQDTPGYVVLNEEAVALLPQELLLYLP